MNLRDIQGLVFHAYRRHPFAAYVLLRFADDPHAVQAWLGEVIGSVDSAEPKDVGPPGEPAIRINIAFTSSGLKAIGLAEDARQTFPLAFRDGLGRAWLAPDRPDHRSRILGDEGASAPQEWAWGNQADPAGRVDALLIVFAADREALNSAVKRRVTDAVHLGAIDQNGWRDLRGSLPSDLGAQVREPFGFVDGISQPVVRGATDVLKRPTRQLTLHPVDAGELLLGHRDGSRQVSLSPTVADDPVHPTELPPAHDAPGRRDLGYNGTYLVFRQLSQDVPAFDKYCHEQSARLDIDVDRLKALIVGRWQDGSPLVRSPIAHDEALARPPAANDFGYAGDPYGERCPIGAHIRRAYPRDSLTDRPDESLQITNRHRILRRGRPYGIEQQGRVVKSVEHEVGLHFICLNADIERQFEFVQQNWMNDGTFGGLDAEDDPLVGARTGGAASGRVTLPPPPDDRVHRMACGLPRFVTVKGGAYFFLPSLAALRYLAHVPPTGQRIPSPQVVLAEPTLADRIRFLVLARVSIALALALLAMPLTLFGGGEVQAIVRPVLFAEGLWQMAVVSAMASLAATASLLTFRLVQLYAKRRFNVQPPGPLAVTWRRIWLWQAFTLPTIGTVLWLSALDSSAVVIDGWPSVDSLLASLPRLWPALVRFGAAALAGFACAFVVVVSAAVLRELGLRPVDDPDLPLRPEDCLLLPPTAWLARLRGRGRTFRVEFVARLLTWVEDRAASWRPPRGAGYVDFETGRILPGHISGTAFFLVIGTLYLTGWWVLRPPQPVIGFQLPPLAYLLALLIDFTWTFAALTFFLDRYRVPLFTIVAGYLALATVIGGTDHLFPVSQNAQLTAGPTPQAMIAQDPQPDSPVIVVAAGGGGVYQAAWVARVLTGLAEMWGDRFSAHVRFLSGASAGSVGIMHFVNAYTAGGLPESSLAPIRQDAGASASSDIWWGLAYPDLLRIVLPSPLQHLLRGTYDRGWAMDQAWLRALHLPAGAQAPTMGAWRTDVRAGWRPAVAFNAMTVENGERAVLSTSNLDAVTGVKTLDVITGDHDLSVVTAARLSATFPFVTPAARPGNGAEKRPQAPGLRAASAPQFFHLIDGGYWDNYGFVTTLEWLRAAGLSSSRHPVIVITIPPPPATPQQGRDQAWVWQDVAPLLALESMRTNAQEARNNLEKQQFKDWWHVSGNPPAPLVWVDFEHQMRDAPLSWNLTRRDGCAVDIEWSRAYASSDQQFKDIEGVLGAPNPASPTITPECEPFTNQPPFRIQP